MQDFILYVDVLGACNLRCPSCPKGNSRDLPVPGGFMSPEFLERILEKALRECNVLAVALYNWTEPFLHPKLAELIRLVHQHGVCVSLSTNLNYIRNLQEVISERPEGFTVSLSGFTKENYDISHRGGNIEQVKNNLLLLAELHKELNPKGYVEINFHRYHGNLVDEVRMREYAEELGLKFRPLFAGLSPLETALDFLEFGLEARELPNVDPAFVERIIHPNIETNRIIKSHSRYHQRTCKLQTDQIVLNHLGEVQLCCTVYDPKKFGLGNFLDLSIDEIQQRRFSHSFCNRCMDVGFNVIVSEDLPELREAQWAEIQRKNLS